MRFPVVLQPAEDGWLIAHCPLVPGCISQGKDRAEALANIREAIELCLATREEEGATWSLPLGGGRVDLEVTLGGAP